MLVFAQLYNCCNARSERASAFRHLFANRWLWAAIALSALLQIAVVHVSFLNIAFGTTALMPDQWLACIALGSAVLWLSELRRLVWRPVAPAADAPAESARVGGDAREPLAASAKGPR